MNLFVTFLIAFHILGMVSTILLIGKKREPITSGGAVIGMIVTLVVIYGLLNWI